MRRLRGAAGPAGGPSASRGAVTAEFAVAIPAVIVLLGVLLSAAAAGVSAVRAEEAARAGARSVARGEGTDGAGREVARVAGPEATHTVEAAGRIVTVRVTLPVPGSVAAAAGLRASAAASLAVEGTP
ncbi:TadE family type IV pilus minor pilin [Sinomonas mesophila]|uniref:TadE family type IV pilus minor pilin n=1 Tax=Sinomonas mesophila TaxID=1531955 RepID=UPI0009861302|nr:TadE family type IV pilus minor pilin [Sinomonas mesophila]